MNPAAAAQNQMKGANEASNPLGVLLHGLEAIEILAQLGSALERVEVGEELAVDVLVLLAKDGELGRGLLRPQVDFLVPVSNFLGLVHRLYFGCSLSKSKYGQVGDPQGDCLQHRHPHRYLPLLRFPLRLIRLLQLLVTQLHVLASLQHLIPDDVQLLPLSPHHDGSFIDQGVQIVQLGMGLNDRLPSLLK